MSAVGNPTLSAEDAKSAGELGMTPGIWSEIAGLSRISRDFEDLSTIIDAFGVPMPTTTQAWYALIGELRAGRAAFGPALPVYQA